MATHKRTVSELSQTELAIATGVSIPTVRLRLAQPPAIRPARTDGRTCWYSTADALRRILGPMGVASGGAEVLDLASERARLAKAQAAGQEMRNGELAGALIRRDEVKNTWARMALSWKERIRSVPMIAMSRIPGFTKPQARVLAELIDATLVEIADGKPMSRTASVRKHRRKASR